MSHYDIDYSELSREEADACALKDLNEWLSPLQQGVLMHAARDPETSISFLLGMLNFAGIQGYPVHAFLRKHRLADYRAWMAEASIKTDAEGFRLEEPK